MKTLIKILAGWMVLFLLQPLFGQNLMVIHQGNGTRIQLPIESIDSIRFVSLPPPVVQKIFQNNGNVLALAVNDIDSITYDLPNPQSLPQVSTQSVTATGTSMVYAQGAVLSDGGAQVTQRGFCWSLQPMPSLGNNFTVNGSGTGSFGASLTPLQAGTLYYVRSYATNSNGTAYGVQLTVNTQAPNSGGSLATVSTSAIQYGPQQGLSGISGGNVTADGGLAVTARGVCWAIGTTPTLNHNFTVDGAGAGAYSSNLSNLQPNTTYFVRAYATNDAGTAYGVSYAFTTIGLPVVSLDSVFAITGFSASVRSKVLNDGGASIISRGVCWSTNPNPTTDLPTKTIDGSGSGSFSSSVNSLQTNSIYYLRSWARNSGGTTYSGQISFTTASVGLPTVSTNMVSSISSSSAICGGFIQNDGGGAIIERGVCWSTSPNPTIALSTKTSDGTGSGNFTSNLGGLNPNTVYYLRAYATNSAGTSYGNQVNFITENIDYSSFASVQLFAPTADNTSKTFMSLTTGITYSFTEASSNSASIDLGYFYGFTAQASFTSASDYLTTAYDLTTWPTRNVTSFRATSVIFDNINSASGLAMSYDGGSPATNGTNPAGGDTRIYNLTDGQVIAFRTASDKKGLIKILSRTGTAPNVNLTISIKVQN